MDRRGKKTENPRQNRGAWVGVMRAVKALIVGVCSLVLAGLRLRAALARGPGRQRPL